MYNLSNLSIPQLEAIRSIVIDGVPASSSKTANADGSKALKKLKTENADLKREKRWREIVTSYDLDYDEDPQYWLSFETEDKLRWLCNKINWAKKEAEAEASNKAIFRIPPLFADQRSVTEILRDHFREKRNGNQQN